MAIIIDGKATAKKLRQQVAQQAAQLPRKPGLAVILVGEDPASQIYVRNKEKDCALCGFESFETRLPAETTQEALLGKIAQLNADPAVDGILVQLPLPRHIDEHAVLSAIRPDKDADAFHPENVGLMVTGEPLVWPCTPFGIMELLREYGISAAGKHCVVVGRSNIVGKPMALLLLRDNGTVTICHSRTPDLASEVRRADILVAAVGKPGLIPGEWVREGAVVIDVAMNRGADGKLCGDVDFEGASARAAYITPVPGGVGPMTRAVLMRNVLALAQAHLAK
ncbi:MAG: bifunctional methylenetetrahydrofolate dehydrogenase/methenyltetrahydrofolate cyclohydrolase FolD [Clostridia bacterium]|nr:bifunctional methylenetetrahydrofolate dehydrogenase/methenyltetrahydrofolate cyclohydrolase FolD [Clostridia bacterium]MDY2929431.1 bifunctional methylenetetrahydrofolate dehydrogenase/methenyltetrahydrofolate cyclohydrolase FolD [Clostridiaceae bacterium]